MKTILMGTYIPHSCLHLSLSLKRRTSSFTKPAALGLFLAALLVANQTASAQNAYFQHNLVSDIAGLADNTDTNLVNPWGIASSSSSPFWVSANHAGLSTLYNGSGVPQTLIVTIPTASGGTPPASPTGVIFNNTTDFPVSPGVVSRFIFATEDGTIAAWNNANGTTAVRKVDNSGSGAVYKGLTMGASGGSNFLYAANFSAGKIDVFDTNFTAVTLAGPFTDPTLPAGLAPFNVQNIGGKLFVTYAVQDGAKHDDVAGPGNGIISVFGMDGSFLNRFATSNLLNSPWGMVVAPANFGSFAGTLLVGNFGNGRINAFDPVSGALLGTLQDPAGNPIVIQGLWGLIVGNGGNGGDTRTVYFAAGIPGSGALEDHGLFGSISAVVPTFSSVTNNGIAVGLNWVSGAAPFLLQKKVGLNDANWANVLTTSNRNVAVAEESSSGFFRLQGLSTNTVLAFTALLNGASEVPPTGSAGTGLAALSLEGSNLNYYISFSGLSGPATMAHMHAPATPTNTAGVMVGFTVPSASAGIISGQATLTPDQITNFVNGLCYVNIHTTLNSGGEIRGQVVPLHMVTTLNGASEVPPVTPAGTATGSLTFIGSQLFYDISYSGLTSGATMAHIHGPADTTTSAGVLVGLATPSGTSGTISGSVTLTPEQMGFVLGGLTYVNIHTVNNGGGEIRGQIWPVQFRAIMNGSSEVPAIASAGSGFGLMNLISNKLSYSFNFTNLTSAATMAHIHGPADSTHTAGVIVPFAGVPSATFGSFSGSTTLSSDQLFDMISGLTYANIHTVTNGGGEIRGQIVPHN